MTQKPRTALLVDDERLARTQLRSQLAHFPDLRVVAEADSVPRALEAVERVQPDVVFLDIQMPGATGFDFLEQASGNFELIFVTAFDKFALRAFEVNALDYLLKPVRLERLSAALQRFWWRERDAQPASAQSSAAASRAANIVLERARHAVPLQNQRARIDDAADTHPNSALTQIQPTYNTPAQSPVGARHAVPLYARLNIGAPLAPPLEYSDYLFVSSGTNARFLQIRAIKYILAAGSYSEVFAADGRKWMLLQPIKDWEERLPSPQFARTHRSCIINLEYVERVDPLGNDTFNVFMRDRSDPLPISRRYAHILKDRLR
jgi:DNA-binding LytR/AlgR family response regulator